MKKRVRARVGIYNRIVDAVTENVECIVFKSINPGGLEARYVRPFPPARVAWWFLLQEINDYAKSADKVALVTGDEIPDDEERRRDLAMFRQEGTFGDYRRSRLPNILDTIHFAPSHYSRLIQAVDCAVFIYHRHKTVMSGDPRQLAAVKDLYNRITGDIDCRAAGLWP